MKPASDHPSPSRQQLLEQLADGQLSGESYRDLLRSLDSEADGWKRCALAFLEDQALCRELGEVLAPTSSAAAPAATPHVTASPALAQSASRTGWFAVAAAVLAAFGLGLLVRGGIGTAPQSPPAVPVATVPEPDRSPVAAESAIAVNDLAAAASASGIDELTVVVGEGDQQQSFRLPVNEVDAVDESYLSQQQWTFTGATQQALAEQGLQGTSRRGFVPIDLGDGRQMIVPVEQVVIQPLAYQ